MKVKNGVARWRSKLASIVAVGCFVGLSAASTSALAACTYKINGSWNNGFNATVTLTNTTSSAINGWSVQWSYSGDNRVVSGWNASITGTNPYTASSPNTLSAGASASFGFTGQKSNAATEVPVLTGSICTGVTTPPTSGKVYIQVDRADDFVFVYVDGVQKLRWAVPKWSYDNRDVATQARLAEKIDITHLLGKGDNVIRVVAAANAGERVYGGYNVRIWKDSTVVFNQQAAQNDVANISAITLDKSVTINLPNAPAKKTLSITSSVGGEAIYLNNVYTGKKVPATFTVAPGDYRVGLGESTSSNDFNLNTVNFTGKYRQQDVTVSTQNTSLAAGNIPQLTKVNSWKVALVPYARVYQGITRAQANAGVVPPAAGTGFMTGDDILVAKKSLEETSAKWLKPMSYGLMKWDVTVVPTVSTPVYLAYDVGMGHDFRWNPTMVNADLSQYDLVVHLVPSYVQNLDANGNRVFVNNFMNGAFAGRPNAVLPSHWMDGEGRTLAERLQNVRPSSGLLHESLHVFDGYLLNSYNGIDQLHGAEVHGYGSNACGMPNEWVCWYTNYIRGQIGEGTSSKFTTVAANPLTGSAVATYTGVFDLMREGKGPEQMWSFSKPVASIENLAASSCLDVAQASTADDVAIVSWSCHGGTNQQWSFKHAQNGAYYLVSENSQKCAEWNGNSLIQKTCGITHAQRYLLNNNQNGTYQLKTLAGKCLSLTASNDIAVQTCDTASTRQAWKLN